MLQTLPLHKTSRNRRNMKKRGEEREEEEEEKGQIAHSQTLGIKIAPRFRREKFTGSTPQPHPYPAVVQQHLYARYSPAQPQRHYNSAARGSPPRGH